MMPSILLDTQIVLWWIGDNQKLNDSTIKYVKDADKVFVSVISFWEMIIKKQIGKLEVPANVRQLVADQNFSALPFETDHAFLVDKLPLFHRDPFDRALIAQAISENLVLATHDKIINDHYHDLVSLFNTRSK